MTTIIAIDGPAAAGKGTKSPLILVTAHRRENFGKPLENICSVLVLNY